MQKTHKLIYLHIPKTAGTAMKQALAAQYPREGIAPVPDDFRVQDDTHYPILGNMGSMGYQMQAEPAYLNRYDLVMGHYDWRLVERLSPEFKVLVMLRHPVEQLVSLYNYYKETPDADREGSHAMCNRLTFREWLDTEHCHMRLNQACQVLSGKRHGVWVDYDSAERNMGKCMVGVLEIFSRSMGALVDEHEIDLPTVLPELNMSSVAADSIGLDDETLALAEHNQRYDMMLYEKAFSAHGDFYPTSSSPHFVGEESMEGDDDE